MNISYNYLFPVGDGAVSGLKRRGLAFTLSFRDVPEFLQRIAAACMEENETEVLVMYRINDAKPMPTHIVRITNPVVTFTQETVE